MKSGINFKQDTTMASTNAFTALLGPNLLTKDGEKPTADVLSGKSAVALYFSAHWCPPCRGFTPKLAEMYRDAFEAKGMEIVFVSSDRDEAAFGEYFGEQPWAALPFGNREAKAALSKKFKVSGIPSLVILDGATAEVITTDGRAAVEEDPAGANYPWTPPTKEEQRAALLACLPAETKAGGKPIGLYFSAHWCPPCRGFTPKLAEMYRDGLQDNLEILFVSSDRDQAAFDGYAAEQPWPALPFAEREAKAALSKACGVEGIPSLVVIDSATGAIITTDGRAKLGADPKGATIAAGGWLPQPFNDVNDSTDGLNEEQCIVALGDDSAMAAAVKAAAEEQHRAAGGDIEAMEQRFFTAPAGGVEAQIRGLCGVEGNMLVLLDIPDGGKFYVCEGGAKDAAAVGAFIAAVKAGDVEKRSFKARS